MEDYIEMRCNTKYKIYPDGNFIATTTNRPYFLTPSQRLYLKEKRLQEQEEAEARRRKYAECAEDYVRTLYSEDWHRDFVESIHFHSASGTGIEECNSLILEVIKKARRLGIPVNGEISVQHEKSKVANIRRARDMIFDLIYLNDFEYFATFTFNLRKTDSFDVESVMKTVKKWIDNHQQRNGLKYVMVPEHHKSGSIHLHMLYSGDLKLVQAVNPYTGKDMFTKDGKPIYNCKSWSYGFSTVIPVDDNKPALAFYVSKYVTKDVKKIFGKYYYSSQKLRRNCDVRYDNRYYSNIQAPSVYVEAIDTRFKYESSIQFNSMDAEDNTLAILKALGVESV